MHKKANKTDMTLLEQDLASRIQSVEDSCKSKLEQILSTQDKFMQIVESGELFKSSKLSRHSPQMEDLRKRLDLKLDRRELETYNQECITNIERVKDEVDQVVQRLSNAFDLYKSSFGKFTPFIKLF